MQLLRMTQANEGRTCVQDNKIVLFVLDRGTSCKAALDQSFKLEQRISIDAGTNQYLECSAVTRRSGLTDVSSLSYILDAVHDANMEEEFSLLSLDLRALVTNDGLRVDHFGSFDRMICMETAAPEAILDHIRDAGAAQLPFVRVEISEENCQGVSRRVQDQQWPTFQVAERF